jgi:hypothetical protein
MAALTIRKDRTPVMLRKLAKAEEDARVGRRMLAIANALDGMSREAAAQAAGMDRQTLRDWVMRLFCEDQKLSLCVRGHRADVDMSVFCFAERVHAEQFRDRFGGEFIDPKDRPKWPGSRR